LPAVRLAQDADSLRQEIEAMRVKQIKEQLDALGKPHQDLFEKDDLVQRLIDARASGEPADDASEAAGPTAAQIREGTEMFMSDPESISIMAELESNTKLQKAAMDIAANGDASRYADDPEVMTFMRRLEEVSKRGMGSA